MINIRKNSKFHQIKKSNTQIVKIPDCKNKSRQMPILLRHLTRPLSFHTRITSHHVYNFSTNTNGGISKKLRDLGDQFDALSYFNR